MIPNKYRGVSFDKNSWISRFSGKSWTAGHLVTPFFYKNNFIRTRFKFCQKLKTTLEQSRLGLAIVNVKSNVIFLKLECIEGGNTPNVEIDRISIVIYSA